MAAETETQPLLATDDERSHVDLASDNSSQQQHFCARCAAELRSQEGHKHVHKARLAFFMAAIILCILIFVLAVVKIAINWWPKSHSVLLVFIAIWADVTITLLALLLHAGRRCKPDWKLSRTIVQIRILCALACVWIGLLIGISALNHAACFGGYRDSCGFFSAINVLSWFLFITLFSAAYVTYRRAITTHGAGTVAVSVQIPAWRISNISEGEGAIRI